MKIIKTAQYKTAQIESQVGNQTVAEYDSNKIPTKTKWYIRKEIARRIDNYYPSIIEAIKKIDEILKRYNYYLSNEDGTPHEAMFAGEQGKTNLNIADKKGNLLEDYIILNWYKMPIGGQYEINTYMN